MRVISGSAGGLRLVVPQLGVRPTTDRTKAAIFSWLNQGVKEAVVLDLFAGTGALGIEAISRGAASAVFVEASTDTADILKRNLKSTRTAPKADVRVSLASAYLKAGPPPRKFDIIFCDPPWIEKGADNDWVGWILENERLPAFLAPGGWFILEAPSERRLKPGPLWENRDQRRYGTTTVHYLRPTAWNTGGEG